jgi:hypothetical protein
MELCGACRFQPGSRASIREEDMIDTLMKAYQDRIEATRKAFGDFPDVSLPPAFREITEKGVLTCRKNCENLTAVVEQTNGMIEVHYTAVSNILQLYNEKTIDALHSNLNSTLDYSSALLSAKTFAEATEIHSQYIRKQFETLSAQTRNFSIPVQKTLTENPAGNKNRVEKTAPAPA